MEHTIKTLLAQGKSQRRISRELGISRKVVRRIKSQLESDIPTKGYHREGKLDRHEETVQFYLDKGLSAVLIHQKLVSVHGLAISYHTVRRFVSGLKGQEVFVPIVTDPGEEAQVDFGYLGKFDLEDGTS
ncbi:MAG: IS21 family transposase, partial [Bacteroidota bacterium]